MPLAIALEQKYEIKIPQNIRDIILKAA